MRAPLAALGGALAALLASQAFAASPRVLSLDQCADQYVLALSPRQAIVGLSKRADDADSYLRARSAALPLRRPTLETVLAARPQVVVRYWGGDQRLADALARRGVTVVRVEDAEDFVGVRANARRVAAALDEREAGEDLVRRMDAELAASRGAWAGKGALYLTPGGFTAGGGTLIDAMLRAAGLANLARGPGFQPVPLERLALDPPSALVQGFFDSVVNALQRWSPGRHRIVRRLEAEKSVVSLPASILGCPAWFAADGSLAIAHARR
jgi:iron complex transport system substrate-binding protein